MFASAMVLGRAAGEDYQAAITFANYVGALQFTKCPGTKVGASDVCADRNLDYADTRYRRRRLVKEIPDEKERIVSAILGGLGRRIDCGEARYRGTSLLAAKDYAAELDRLGTYMQPGHIVFIDGEAGAGKGAILDNLSAFVTGYDAVLDKYNAHALLDVTPQGLETAMKRAEERKTCLVLDEIQAASDEGVSQLLTVFPHQDLSIPYCVICAGHFDSTRGALRDLFARAAPCQFVVLPLRDRIRRPDLPYLIARQVAKTVGSNAGIGRISALALRELLRCDYDTASAQNTRALQTVVTASCRKAKGATLEWEDVDLESIRLTKATVSPSIPRLNYEIELSCR